VQQGFARMENRLEQVYNHVDGFMKLHETLDIEFRVIKEQMRRPAKHGAKSGIRFRISECGIRDCGFSVLLTSDL
jgi:hypothetical protein